MATKTGHIAKAYVQAGPPTTSQYFIELDVIVLVELELVPMNWAAIRFFAYRQENSMSSKTDSQFTSHKRNNWMISSCGLLILTLILVAKFAGGPETSATAAEVFQETEDQPKATSGVLVELFTSQGCNSCPPADQLLAEIKTEAKKEQQATFVLSYHVDYWNDLGWPDPFSQAKFSRRQRLYARAFASQRIYTPQMVINGQASFVGSDRQQASVEINKAQQQSKTIPLHLSIKQLTDSTAKLRYRVANQHQYDWNEYQLVVALVHSPPDTEVERGENANRKLKHVNVVRSLQFESIEEPEGEMELKIPAAFQTPNQAETDWSVIAFVQELDAMKVLSVGQTSLKNSPSDIRKNK